LQQAGFTKPFVSRRAPEKSAIEPHVIFLFI
jgi:hypothetical protein